MPADPTRERNSDEALAEEAQRGSRDAFEELVRRYQVPLVRFLARIAGDVQAEDLTQDTLLKAYKNLHRYRPQWRFQTWLFTIARRLGLNRRRTARAPGADWANVESLASPAASPADAAAASDDRRRLWELAAKVLGPRKVSALWLHYVEEMPTGEIAQVLGCSRVAVKTMLFRSRKRLFPLLDEVENRPCNLSRVNAARTAAAEVPRD